jgi:hypothetical protein
VSAIALVMLALVVGCSVAPDFRDSMFACSDNKCPEGYACDPKIAACVPERIDTCGGPGAFATTFDTRPPWLIADSGVMVSQGKLRFAAPGNGGVGTGSRRPFGTFDLTRGDLIIRGISLPAPETGLYLNLSSQDVYRGIVLAQRGGVTRLALVDGDGNELAATPITGASPIDVRVHASERRLELFVAANSEAWQAWASRDEDVFALELVNLEMYVDTQSGTGSTVTIDEIASDRDSPACQPSAGFADDFRQPALDPQWGVNGAPCTVMVTGEGIDFTATPGDECMLGLRRAVDLRGETLGMFRTRSDGPYLLRIDAYVGADRVTLVVKATGASRMLSTSTCIGNAQCVDRFKPDLDEPWIGLSFSPTATGTSVSAVAGAAPDMQSRIVDTVDFPTSVAQAVAGISFRSEASGVSARVDAFTATRTP